MANLAPASQPAGASAAPEADRARLIAALSDRLGSAVVAERDAIEPYLRDWFYDWLGKDALAVLRPADTAGVSRALQVTAELGLTVVPQGGNTGLVGGTYSHGDQVILSLERLNRIRDVDPLDNSMVVEAGVILTHAQEAAAAAGRYFPLSLGSEGTARIGGLLSTNAGGLNVVRYGQARDLVLGLEVVLADGRVWNGLKRLRKDNTGYDLRHLFIGAEGTLGIITAAVVKLFPPLRDRATALVALRDIACAVPLFARIQEAGGGTVNAFELIERVCIDEALARVPGTVDPVATRADWYILMELASPAAEGALTGRLEAALEAAMADGLVADGTIASSEAQRARLWHVREALVEALRHQPAQIKHDLSVRVSQIPALIQAARAAVATVLPGVRPYNFGHVGDGNLHFNVIPGADDPDGARLRAHYDQLNAVIFQAVADLDGSVSAEHGIGLAKQSAFLTTKDPVALELMGQIKRLLDPDWRLNPGKMLPVPGGTGARG